jgi:phosphoribosylformylglycinamidine cyclo-ligase
VLIGLPSTGLHTNGYSLARNVLFTHFDVDEVPSQLPTGETVGEALLRVHRSYLRPIRALVDAGLARAFAHVTGGGLTDNTRRVLPPNTDVYVDFGAWARPPLFDLIQALGDVPETDMRRTFNLGIGLVAVVDEADADAAVERLEAEGEQPVVVGRVITADG